MNRRQFVNAIVVGFVLGSLLLTIERSVADEPKSGALIQTLPKDGTWAEFNVNVKLNGQEIVPSWKLRSVGQAFHGGKQCRFIEMEQTCDHPQLQNATWRLLVPEEEFGEGKDPLSKMVKCWVKFESGEPEVVESIPLKDPAFAMLLAGPKQNLKTEEAKEKSVGSRVTWSARWSAATTRLNSATRSSACRIESSVTKTCRSAWPECSKS